MPSHVETVREIATELQAAYVKTPAKIKLLDAFSACALITAVLQVRGSTTGLAARGQYADGS